ncbi:MAG: ATP-dependent DNA helicase [Parvibaculaceae bacterium]|nr:ATP-dependent DNA helicase [Parvibaculaceae bacterium]
MTDTSLPDSSSASPVSPAFDGPLMPELPALVPAPMGGVSVDLSGEIIEHTRPQAMAALRDAPHLICHRLFTSRRVMPSMQPGRGQNQRPPLHPSTLDILELFAFVYPARPCLPTPLGVMRALALTSATDEPSPEDLALGLLHAMQLLLSAAADQPKAAKDHARSLAHLMTQSGWGWGQFVLAALGPREEGGRNHGSGYSVWADLEEWEEQPPPPRPAQISIAPDKARQRLALLVGPDAEQRRAQSDFAAKATLAFDPPDLPGAPNVLLAEAGTGTGKTLGYIAPASLWAEQNEGTVWISTYTKNLQRQLDQELDRLYPNPVEKREKAVIRKGRENYLCLLNYEEGANRAALGVDAVATGLVARWMEASRDGDMVGGDFPAWLPSALDASGMVPALTDRRGECMFSACPHYKKCFVEKAIRKSHHAEIVVANHALVLRRAALASLTYGSENKLDGHETLDGPGHAAGAEDEIPTADDAMSRIVFDEGHQLFDAADSAFSAHITGLETAELRRWIRGTETRSRARGRGLLDRAGDLLDGHSSGEDALQMALKAAGGLPAPGWQNRLADGQPKGAAEKFLASCRQLVLARSNGRASGYSLETGVSDLPEAVLTQAGTLDQTLSTLSRAFKGVIEGLRDVLDDGADRLEPSTRVRIDALIRGLERRNQTLLLAWRRMLGDLVRTAMADKEGTPDREAGLFVSWFSLDRDGVRDVDTGLHRHWIDPTRPLVETVYGQAHGVLITSATLRDEILHPPSPPSDGDAATASGTNVMDAPSVISRDWENADTRTGARHLPHAAQRAAFSSPFDYAKQARILVVKDVNRNSPDQVAAAYRELFLASHGGALGLFTAIRRLRDVQNKLLGPLSEHGLPLYAQHVDAIDPGTLIDIFKAETDSCLLGTDAIRDGVDVPGRSLRLIVFDRTPWARPDILHKARRETFGKSRYDDMITRLKLKQAFGRLIRSHTDRGIFVMLDAQLPTRLTTAFPAEIDIERVGLAQAVETVRLFNQD